MKDDGVQNFLSADEWLARFVLNRRHIRADGTVKREAFVPYKWVELSVTRHLGLNDSQIWEAGDRVAAQTKKGLQGRADAQAATYAKQELRTVAAPVPENSNHANVIDWPQDKQAQMEKALEISRDVNREKRFLRKPG
jgi:hypothetical protein